MDDGWVSLFLSANYAMHFEDGVCFADATFAPFGYVCCQLYVDLA